MKVRYSNSIIHAYIAYLKTPEHFILGASQDKKVLKYYLENNRHLFKHEYQIESTDMPSSQYYIRYSHVILEEVFDGIYIPKRDLDIIERDSDGLAIDISHTIENLQKYAYLLNHIKKTQEEVPKIVDTIQILDHILKKDKLYNKLEDENYKSHPILYCKLNDYMKYIKMYNEEKNMNMEYKRSIE